MCVGGGRDTKTSFPKTSEEVGQKRCGDKVCRDSSFGGNGRRGFLISPTSCLLQLPINDFRRSFTCTKNMTKNMA